MAQAKLPIGAWKVVREAAEVKKKLDTRQTWEPNFVKTTKVDQAKERWSLVDLL